MRQPIGPDDRETGEEFFGRVVPRVTTGRSREGAEPAERIAPTARPDTKRAHRPRSQEPAVSAGRRRFLAFGAASSLVALLLVAALAPHEQLPPNPAPVSPTPPPATAATTARLVMPTIGPHAGVSVLDTGYGLTVQPSPHSRYVAVAETGSPTEPETVAIFTPEGTAMERLPGAAAAWIDDQRLLLETARPTANTPMLVVHTVGDPARDVELPEFGHVFGGSDGLVALIDSGSLDGNSGGFRLWSMGGGLQPHQAGMPIGWSPDGRLLAVWQSVPTGSTGTADVGAGVLSVVVGLGSEPTGIRQVPGLPQLAAFSPAGTRIAAFNPSQEPMIVDVATGDVEYLPTGAEFVGWTPDSAVVVRYADGTLRILDGGTTMPSLPHSAARLVYGPSYDLLAIVEPDPSGTGDMVTVRMHGSSETFQGLGSPNVTWLSDGSACLLDAGTNDASEEHDLYRVALP